jgi:hypothetical protein
MLDRLSVGTWAVIESNITIRGEWPMGTLVVARATDKPFDPAIAVISNLKLTPADVTELANTEATITFVSQSSLGALISGDRGYVNTPKTVAREAEIEQFLKK